MVFAAVPGAGKRGKRCMGGVHTRCRSRAAPGSRYCKKHGPSFEGPIVGHIGSRGG